MLQLIILATETYDEIHNEFINTKSQTIQLEHSLLSISRWESKWCKPFLDKTPKTIEETIDYIKCMTLTPNIADKIYKHITNDNIKEVSVYIEAPMTATWFTDNKKGVSREVITSEIIYYWMVSVNIPFECQKWHLNRLLTLIRVCDKKNTPNKQMSKSEILSRNAILNNERREKYNNKG